MTNSLPCGDPSGVLPFRVWNARHAADRVAWLAAWQSWPTREIHAHPDYVRLVAAGPGEDACCAHADSTDGKVLFPFLLRDLTQEPYWSPAVGPATDAISPYGYGGPFAWDVIDRWRLADRFFAALDQWAREHRVVSEFVRFCLDPESVLEYPGVRIENQQNIVRSLEADFEQLVAEMPYRVRYDVRRSAREGIRVEPDATGERLEEFLRLYIGTMQRRQARSHYYFPREFFQTIHHDLAGHFIYFHALHQGRVVSSDLILVSAENVYLYLSATDHDAYPLRPNHPLKFATIRWAQQQGKKRFILGGGYQPGDGVFRYKHSFAPHGVVPFHVGQRILRPDAYRQLTANRRAGGRPGQDTAYFPAYRAA